MIVCPICGFDSRTPESRRELARKAGSTRSKKKAEAARRNGRKGGRPTDQQRMVGSIMEFPLGKFRCSASMISLPSRRAAIKALRDDGRYTHYFSPEGRLIKL